MTPILHRWWTGPPSPLEPWLSTTLHRLHRGWQVHNWTDATLPTAVLADVDRSKSAVQASDALRHRSNLVRLSLLVRFGGWWLDSDVVLLRSLATLPDVPTVAAVGTRLEGCLIGAEAGNPAIAAALAVASRSTPASTPAVLASGAAVLSTYLRSFRPEPGIIPFGSDGTPTKASAPFGVHLWLSTSNGHEAWSGSTME